MQLSAMPRSTHQRAWSMIITEHRPSESLERANAVPAIGPCVATDGYGGPVVASDGRC